MNTTELVDAVAASQGIAKAEVRKTVDAVLAAIADAATQGEEISLNAFGKFKVKDVPAREAVTPRPANRSRSRLRASSASRRPRP